MPGAAVDRNERRGLLPAFLAGGGAAGVGRRAPRQGEQRGVLLPAFLASEEAGGMEGTAGRQVDQRGGRPGDRLEPLLVLGQLRQAVHEADRVRVTWGAEDRLDRARLDDVTRVHDEDA